MTNELAKSLQRRHWGGSALTGNPDEEMRVSAPRATEAGREWEHFETRVKVKHTSQARSMVYL